jgi:uncharacterized phage protein (TIGR01671 family)
MVRDIEFRGKRKDNGKWVFGYLYKESPKAFILYDDQFWQRKFTVFSETVGQYTGLKDRNGVKIFEGDILRYPPKGKWDETSFVAFEVFWHDNNSCDGHIGWQFNRLHFHGNIAGYCMIENFIPKYTEKMEVVGTSTTTRNFWRQENTERQRKNQ